MFSKQYIQHNHEDHSDMTWPHPQHPAVGQPQWVYEAVLHSHPQPPPDLRNLTAQNFHLLQFLHRIIHLSYLYQTTSSQLLKLCQIKVVMFDSFFKMLHIPWPLSRDARLRAFPPGAAQQSIIISPGCASTTATTSPAWQEILHI